MLITGKIYFTCVPFGREIEDFIAFLTRCAEENRIWINTGGQIRNPDDRNYDRKLEEKRKRLKPEELVEILDDDEI